MQPVIELRNVSKVYHGATAVSDVSLQVKRGEIHALLGENGAGKSTLTKMMAGIVSVTSGEIWLDGLEVRFDAPLQALKAGIAMVFQETSLVAIAYCCPKHLPWQREDVQPSERPLHRCTAILAIAEFSC